MRFRLLKKIPAVLACAASLGLLNGVLEAQSSLVLSSGTGTPGATVPLNLTLTSTSGNLPAAIQWSLGYSTGVASLSVTPGAAVTAAGKSITCGTNGAGMVCIAVGNNANTIANGVVATVNVTLTANATSAAVTVTNTFAASAAGESITSSGTGATVLVVQTITISSLTCSPNALNPAGSSTCAVSLSAPAGSGGVTVGVGCNMPDVSVPAAVAIGANSSSATFAATADNFGKNESATITTTLGSSTAQSTISLVVLPTLTGIQCGASTLATSANTSCTVTLSAAAPAGGAVVLLSNGGSIVLSVPASVTVAANSTSTSFAVSTGAFTGSSSVSLTATFGSSMVSTGLTATAGPVSLACSPSTITAGQSGNCTVSMAGPGVAAKTVTLQSGNAGLSVPASVTVASGSASATFAFTSTTSFTGTATVTASAESASQSASVSLQGGPPTASITSPTSGASLSGTVTVTASASNSVSVQFTLDGANLGSAVSGAGPSYSTLWNTTAAANGSHTLAAIATNAAGTQTTASVSVTVNNPLLITSAAAGGMTSSSATITWSTNQAANSQVAYGATSSYGLASAINSAMVTAHSVVLSGLTPSATYHYQAQSTNAQGVEAASADLTFTTSAQTTSALLEVQMSPSEVGGTRNGSTVTPAIGPGGFTGSVVVTGSGSVNYAPVENGNGAYFLSCCTNSNNAYYQFVGTTIGNIFNMSQGQVSFALQSRYSFAQRTASAAAARYAFDVQDGSDLHPFYFFTNVVSGRLEFEYAAAGSTQYYYVPAGTENTLYGNGVTLQLTLSWGSGTLNLYLNGALVKSSSYTAATANWTASTVFLLGARQYLTFGGYDSSDDALAGFTVTGAQTAPGVTILSPANGATLAGTVAVSANATDSAGVTQVQFQLDGANLASAVPGSGPTYALNWNTTSTPNGSHTLTAVATDANGNTGSSGGVVVTVNNPPAITAVTAGSIGAAAATIDWTTNQAATSLVAYGLTSGYGTTAQNPALVTSHTINLAGLAPATTYHFQVQSQNAQGAVSSSADYTFTTAALPPGTLLEVQMNSSEVSGTKNGSVLTPTVGPSGFTGSVVVTGSGSVNYTSVENGNGVYFLNCCTNSNNAYYQFPGTMVGNIFGSHGQVSFALKSRYSFAQRTASASAARYAFDVQDGSEQHPFYFYTIVTSGRLAFEYAAPGTTQYYYVPVGTEDALYGNGVVLQVTMSWGSGTLSLYLNGTLVKSASYTPGGANWTASTLLILGGRQYLTFGGYDSSDDAIAGFTVTASASGGQPNVRRQLTSTSAPGTTQTVPAAGAGGASGKPVALSCTPGYASGRQSVICEVSLDHAPLDESTAILLSSDNPNVRVPASVSARPGQTAIRFQAEFTPPDAQITTVISAQEGSAAVQTNLTLSPSRPPSLTVPDKATARPGSTVRFQATATDSNDVRLTAAAANLPPGSHFDAASGRFEWQPSESDLGEHRIAFSAVNAANDRIAKTVSLYVDSGQPTIAALQNGASSGAAAACSPGSVATLTGHSLYAGDMPMSDYSGASTELGGTRVNVNGAFVPVLYGSAEKVSFLCPAGLPGGSALQIMVQTSEGASNMLTSEVADSAPGIFTSDSLEGSKALALAASGELSQIPTPEKAGLPILPRSALVLLATGVPCSPGSMGQLLAKVAQQYVAIQSVHPAGQRAGVCEISIEAPDISGDSLPVELETLGSDGRLRASNVATVSVANR